MVGRVRSQRRYGSAEPRECCRPWTDVVHRPTIEGCGRRLGAGRVSTEVVVPHSRKGLAMHRLVRASTLSIALVLGAVGQAAPAEAGPYDVTVTSGPGVIWADCTGHPFNYSVTPPEDASSWKIELTLHAPDGTSGGSVYVGPSSPTTGVATESFCPGESLPGTYTVTGVYEVLEFNGGMIAEITRTPVTPFTFDLRLPFSEVTARASDKTPKVGHRVKVNVKVADERPAGGFFGTTDAGVQLQRLKGTRWVGVSGTKEYTGSAGTVQLRFRHAWKGKTKFKVVADLGYLGKTSSGVFTLRSRR